MIKRKKEDGMALLETLIAMLIFALALIPLITLQLRSTEATKAGEYKTEISAAVESMMDYLRFDRKAIFNGNWNEVIVWSGMDCTNKGISTQTKIACNVLNKPNDSIYPKGNAMLCVLGKEDKPNDQYLLDIKAIWFSGKRSDDSQGFADRTDCGKIREDISLIINDDEKENIDSINIKMVY